MSCACYPPLWILASHVSSHEDRFGRLSKKYVVSIKKFLPPHVQTCLIVCLGVFTCTYSPTNGLCSSLNSMDLYLRCRLYRDFVLEITIMAVLGQRVEIQNGEGDELKRGIDIGSNASQGRMGRFLDPLLFLPTQLFIGCECENPLCT